MSSSQHNSAQPCGCDPGIPWLCSEHSNGVVIQSLNPKWSPSVTSGGGASTPWGAYPGGAPAGLLPQVQKFATGATRSADEGKNQYWGFLSYPAIEEFGDYMTRHRVQPDGSLRDPNNWQKGIPIQKYIESLLRHSLELWGLHMRYLPRRLAREYPGKSRDFLLKETACAIYFNVQGFLHEYLKADKAEDFSV